jgi:hypothetical protein
MKRLLRFRDHLDATGEDVIEIAFNMKLEGITVPLIVP